MQSVDDAYTASDRETYPEQLVFEKSRVDILKLIQKVNKNRKLFGISPKDHNTLHVYRTFDDNILKLDFLKDLFDYEEDA